jgi:hypothetical protein
MRVTDEFPEYNARRYGKPWIARVVRWDIGEHPELKFGYYNGNENGGRVEIEAEEGDIVKVGRKDYRKPRSTYNRFHIVKKDGALLRCSAQQAREAWDKKSKDYPELTKRMAKEITVEFWTYLAEHPECCKKSDAPEELYTKVEGFISECALCEVCGPICRECPLKEAGVKCSNDNSPWGRWVCSDPSNKEARSKAAWEIVKISSAWDLEDEPT